MNEIKYDLLNCFVCEKKPVIHAHISLDVNSLGEEKESEKLYYVKCPYCGEKAESDYFLEEAVRKWNSRIVRKHEIYWQRVKDLLITETNLRDRTKRFNEERRTFIDENDNWKPINKVFTTHLKE